MKVYLIGMPGSGKTTLGRLLAEQMLLLFVDLDREIERREGKSVQQIFADHGEDYFRRVESETLHELAASEKGFVMATGGGAPCFFNGIDTITKTGLSIFLDVSLTELLRRLDKKTDRPLLNASDEAEREVRLRTLLDKRLPIYNRAHIRVQQPTLEKLLEVMHLRS